MKRYRMSKGKSRKMYRKGAKRTRAINVSGAPRGGYRL